MASLSAFFSENIGKLIVCKNQHMCPHVHNKSKLTVMQVNDTSVLVDCLPYANSTAILHVVHNPTGHVLAVHVIGDDHKGMDNKKNFHFSAIGHGLMVLENATFSGN